MDEGYSMDKNFLEFWGHFLINAAEGQRQLEDMAKWMAQGLEGVGELSRMFQKFYGLNGTDEDSTQYLKEWQRAVEEFQKSFMEYLGLMGVVSKEEYLSLVKKYEELKTRIAEQEETIAHLRMLLDQKGTGEETVMQTFQDLMKKQADEFQELMENVGQLSKSESHVKKRK
jgi:uncharacterized coiled-coil protein SlyX